MGTEWIQNWYENLNGMGNKMDTEWIMDENVTDTES